MKVGKKQKTNEETELQRIQNAIKTKTMNGKPLTDKQIEGLKAGLTQGGNKVEMGEEKKELPKTKMYRKAGNLSRKALSKGLDSKEGSKAQDRSSKIVSVITSDDERKRFDKMKTKKSELRNEEVVDEMSCPSPTVIDRKKKKKIKGVTSAATLPNIRLSLKMVKALRVRTQGIPEM